MAIKLNNTTPTHKNWFESGILTFVLQKLDMPCFCKRVDPDQLASQEDSWSESVLFVIMWICSNNLDQVIWLAEN